MQTTLPKELRRKLESVVVKAREIAESAARTELQRLAVGEKTAASYLSDEQRQLRNRLRAHGRQLGDRRKPDGEQAIARLLTEVAYEHWHRMLFARFLAENDLLIYEDGVTPVSIHDCFELAEEETGDRTLGWQYAARYAGDMLPQIFRVDSPVFQLELAPNDQKRLEQLLTSLDEETFIASDALGWVYQFWQSKKKDEVNAAEVKIGADELPAVTQLFTEPYMVSFLLDNSLGAWWAAQRLTSEDLATASSEEELRSKAAIPGVPLKYLRFVKSDESGWTPASGKFDSWPEDLVELKTLDPCCGSGHFLVAAFLMLVPMRMERENLSAENAVDAVLRENLHGLELDQRCVELAAFALALAAWKYPGASGYRALARFNLACSGLSISAKKDEWAALAGENTHIRQTLFELYDQFREAPILGSLINPQRSLREGTLFALNWEEVESTLTEALFIDDSYDNKEAGVAAMGIAQAAKVIGGSYDWVITNVPYLLRRKQSNSLKSYVDHRFPEAKHDLATVFFERCLELTEQKGGIVQIVLPQNWLFLTQYVDLRRKLLSKKQWKFIARLGTRAFDTIGGDVVNTCLLTLRSSSPNPSERFGDLSVASCKSIAEKSDGLLAENIESKLQSDMLKNVDCIISSDSLVSNSLLNKFVKSFHGLSTTDMQRFTKFCWEILDRTDIWNFQIGTMKSTKHYGGRNYVLRWEQGKGAIDALRGKAPIVITGLEAWGKNAVAISQMGQLSATIYTGDSFLDGTAILLPNDPSQLKAIVAYCESPNYSTNIRKIDKSIKITYSTLAKVPFDVDYWARIATVNYPFGLPKPYTDDPTQWIFHGHPCGSVIWDENSKWTAQGPLRYDDTVLQVTVVRLLGYCWPAELDTTMELADE